MIRSFRHRGLKLLYERNDRRRIHAAHVEKVENILALLGRAKTPRDMDLPGFMLHPLKGRLQGYWAVTVRANWRIVFRFEEGDVVDVDYVDYH